MTDDDSEPNIKDLDQLLILDQTSDAIIITDLDGTVVFWNKQAEKLIKMGKEEVLGKSIFDAFIPHVDAATGMEIVESFQERGEWFGEITVQSRDGQKFIVSVTSSLLKNREGEPVGIIGLGRDITQRKEIDRELKEVAEELRRSNEELERFAYVASHDLQEPLRMVTSYLSLLEKKFSRELSPQAKEYMGFAVQGSIRMRELIDDLLRLSRINSQPFRPDSVDMNEVANIVVKDLHVAIGDAGAEVVLGSLPIVRADEPQMRQLLTNLISNAIKFHSDKPPRIEVSSIDYENDFVFSINDNGIGIDPQYQDKLFKMFSRLHTKDEYPGTGIGLAIAKKIVERHHGRIWFESEPGRGTTFYFTIPDSC